MTRQHKRLTYDWGEHWYSSSGSKKCKACGKRFDLPVIHVASVVTDNCEHAVIGSVWPYNETIAKAIKKALKEYGEAYKKLSQE